MSNIYQPTFTHVLISEIVDFYLPFFQKYDAQTQFFLMHDYDNNTKLDGLELLKSMTHHHDEDSHHGRFQILKCTCL